MHYLLQEDTPFPVTIGGMINYLFFLFVYSDIMFIFAA